MKRRRCTPIADNPALGVVPGIAPGIELLPLLRPYVRQCGAPRRSAWKIGERRLLDYLLIYIAAGEGRFSIAGRSYEVRPNDLFWIPPDTPHVLEGFAPGMHCPYVHFDLTYRPSHSHWDFSIPGGTLDLGELRPLLHEPVAHPPILALAGRIRGYTNSRVGALLQKVCAEAMRAQSFSALRLSGLMLEAIAEILRGQDRASDKRLSHIPQLEQVAAAMATGVARAMPELARQCRLSPSHFRLLFRQHFGCSPRAYARRMRLRRARDLMLCTPLTLSEIAAQVGFASVHGLSRAFRAGEGVAPRDYRRWGAPRTRVEGRKLGYSGA